MDRNSRGQIFRTISFVGNELPPTQACYVKIAKITSKFDEMLFLTSEHFKKTKWKNFCCVGVFSKGVGGYYVWIPI